MTGYYKNPEGTSAVLGADGWLRTGDLAYIDEDGYYFIVGRAKELIIKGGMNIAPRQIDDVLVSHPGGPGSRRAGGPRPLPRRGHRRVRRPEVRAPGADEQQLLDFCESQLGQLQDTERDLSSSPNFPRGPRARFSDSGWASASRRSSRPTRAAGKGVAANGHATAAVLRRPSAPRTPRRGDDRGDLGRDARRPRMWALHENFFGLGGHSLLAIEILCPPPQAVRGRLSRQRFLHESDRGPASRPGERATSSATARLAAGRPARLDRSPASESPRRSCSRGEGGRRPGADSSTGPFLLCPLSPAQERLWFLEQLHPGCAAYNEARRSACTGSWTSGSWKTRSTSSIERHEVLRTLIQVVDDGPCRWSRSSWTVRVERIDLSAPARRTSARPRSNGC